MASYYLDNLGMELRPLVLALLETRPLYGYEIVQQALRRGRLRWEEGTLYPLLHKMESEGLLAARWEKAPSGKDRKYYRVTRRGLMFLEGARSAWKQESRSIERILFGGAHEPA